MVEIRRSAGAEAARVAQLHCEGLPDSLLAALGRRFLTRLYRRIALDRRSFLLVGIADSGVVGFVAGTEDTGALYRAFALQDGAFAGLLAAGHLLRNGRRVWDTWRYGHETLPSVSRPSAELLSLAVDSSARRAGVGGHLVAGFVNEVTRRGLPSAHVVVGASNAPARALYAAYGFREVGAAELHTGVGSVVMSRP